MLLVKVSWCTDLGEFTDSDIDAYDDPNQLNLKL